MKCFHNQIVDFLHMSFETSFYYMYKYQTIIHLLFYPSFFSWLILGGFLEKGRGVILHITIYRHAICEKKFTTTHLYFSKNLQHHNICIFQLIAHNLQRSFRKTKNIKWIWQSTYPYIEHCQSVVHWVTCMVLTVCDFFHTVLINLYALSRIRKDPNVYWKTKKIEKTI